MKKAIGIKAYTPSGVYDMGSSKFFGTPTVPAEWENVFGENEIFFCQIRLSDISELDTENKLPHTGYLYIFLDTTLGKYRLKPVVRYYNGDPAIAIDDFNGVVEGYEEYTKEWLMDFYEADETEDCTRLFGFPSDWNYDDQPSELMMQYDPLDNEMGFLDSLDGFMYLFFGNDKRDFEAVTLVEEHS